eukprot:TRINITY_DN6749_c0_g3_i6.p1 TRINITY_DN6749_c0_g3~~TRINITY_DN6749_c0_g3_i6.p1  ORF type:complete len:114 (-),score=19.72 TRINITY_DN6749_c0_g3_i6:7-312(-)
MVGMAPNTIDVNQDHNSSKCGWYLRLSTGCLYSQSNNGSGYTSQILPNAVIQVKYDKEKRNISYTINGQDKGIAHQNIPPGLALYPCIEFRDRNVFEIVNQ